MTTRWEAPVGGFRPEPPDSSHRWLRVDRADSLVGWSVLLLGVAIAPVWVRYRTAPWQAWLIGVPVLVTLGLIVSDEVAALLPNLL